MRTTMYLQTFLCMSTVVPCGEKQRCYASWAKRQLVAGCATRLAHHDQKHDIASHVAIRRGYRCHGVAVVAASQLQDHSTKVAPANQILGIACQTIQRPPSTVGPHAADRQQDLAVQSSWQ